MALEAILARKRQDVAVRQAASPLPEWQAGLQPSDRPFKPGGETAYILECKRASPSEGVLRADADVEAVARSYAPFATAISVLTDEPYFHGSFADLARVRAVVRQPVLCKDFIVDPYQVYEARRHGADIVLLMLSVLNDETYRVCARAADSLSLDVLTEVHDEAELVRARGLGARIVGINNRNLKTLEIDLSVSESLIGAAPGDLRISESGLSTHAQVHRLQYLGFDGFLVGSSLMKAAQPDVALRQLVFGPVKVCGLRRAEDAAAAWMAGATWGGLIFHEGSPRAVTADEAREVMAGAPLQWVGVFVNQPVDRVAQVARELGLAAVQLHGDESPSYISDVRSLLPCEIWKVYRIKDQLPPAIPFGVDRVLLDTFRDGVPGGTGASWDWSLLADCPYRERVILSGGLTPHNARAADAAGVGMLDVNSGVEVSPGVKSPPLLSAFFSSLRTVAPV